MINSLMISKTGMQAQQMQLDVISNNLANVSTNGFKRATAVFEDLMYQNLRQVGANTAEQAELPTGLQVGLGVRTVATSRNFSQGSMQQSDNPLDIAVNGNGFFQVELPDGTTAYTRDGSFKLTAQGELVTSSGYRVLPGVTIQDPATRSVTIAADGTVTIVAHRAEMGTGVRTSLPMVVADRTVGLIAVQMILMALYHREKTGHGQAIELPMFENIVKATLEEHMYLRTFVPHGDEKAGAMGAMGDPRLIDPQSRPLPTKDGHICISANTNAQAFAVFDAIGQPELKTDPRLSTVAARFKN